MYLRILCKIHVSEFMSQHPHVSQDPLRDPCLRIHSSTSRMYLRILYKIHVFGFVSQHLCVSRILCKIHISGFVSQQLYISGSGSMCPIHVLASSINMDPLQDPCLRIHVSASLYLRIFYKIHVFGFMSQHPLIWILYKIHVFGFMSQHLCISRIFCKIHVSGSVYKHPYVSQAPLQDPCLRIRV